MLIIVKFPSELHVPGLCSVLRTLLPPANQSFTLFFSGTAAAIECAPYSTWWMQIVAQLVTSLLVPGLRGRRSQAAVNVPATTRFLFNCRQRQASLATLSHWNVCQRVRFNHVLFTIIMQTVLFLLFLIATHSLNSILLLWTGRANWLILL